jgi:hypothetical protein
MARTTIITRVRFIAAIAPAILLIAAPFIAGGLYVFGGQVEVLRDHQLAATEAARGMDVALYQMDWARYQRDRDQILTDQARAFGHWLDLARDRAETETQRKDLDAIAAQAGPLFGDLRNSSPQDESIERRASDLHGRVADLIGADDEALLAVAAASRREADVLILATLVAGLAIPWLCFAALYSITGRLRSGLRAIRAHFEHLRDSSAAAAIAADRDFTSIDQSLERLGFPKPNPMLAESE